ncbi:MAG: hypothetical protein QOE39_141 [Bradyrhizobium sp.]|jgi:hypothetical protein|nr:hypothetical protein [Bradyrhizobium sp.]
MIQNIEALEFDLTSPVGRGRIERAMRSIVGAIRVRGAGLNDRSYPLTPTLSPWERERHLRCRGVEATSKRIKI